MNTIQQNNNQPSQALLDSINGSSVAASSSSVDEVQNRFMTLLVTQMRNQDPLNPMDNAQVTSQMAQLSTVTGIDKLNSTVETMIANLQSGQSYQATNMIGHHVFYDGNIVRNNGTGGMLGIDLPNGADKVVISITDGAGSTIRTINMGANQPGTATLSWDGTDDKGMMTPNGSYKFNVKATIGTSNVSANTLSFAQVGSISNESAGLKLNLDSGEKISTNAVKEFF